MQKQTSSPVQQHFDYKNLAGALDTAFSKFRLPLDQNHRTARLIPLNMHFAQYNNNSNEKLVYPLRFIQKKSVYLSKGSYYKIMYRRSSMRKYSLYGNIKAYKRKSEKTQHIQQTLVPVQYGTKCHQHLQNP